MWQKIKEGFEVLQVGKQFKNPVFWKNVQGAGNGVLIVIAFLLSFFPGFEISQEALHIISLAIAYIADALINHQLVTPDMVKTVIAAAAALVWALFNNYFTYGTSAKVGLPQLPKKSEPEANEAQKAPNLLGDAANYGDGTFMESHSLPSYPSESKPTVQPDNSLESGPKGLLGE